MPIGDAQRKYIEERLDAQGGYAPLRRARFLELCDAWGLSSPSAIKRFLRDTDGKAFHRLLEQKPETLIANVEGSASLLGISKGAFIKAALLKPSLFTQQPATIAATVKRSAELLGVTETIFIEAALREPTLFYMNGDRLLANIEASAALLDVSKEEFQQSALKRPQLMHLKPSRLLANVEKNVELLGVDKKSFVHAGMLQPQLLYQNPEKLHANAQASATLLGVSLEAFATAALKRPQVICMKPQKLHENVQNSSTLLNVTEADFVSAAIKQPQLLYQNPLSLQRHAALIARTCRAADEPVSAKEILEKFAVSLGRSDSALIGRFLAIQHGLTGKSSPASVMIHSNASISSGVQRHYEGRLAEAGPTQAAKLTRAMQQLHRLGVIRELPEGVEPMLPRSR